MNEARSSPADPVRQEQMLLDFVTTAGVGLHWVGPDGTILWANPADYEPLGYTADEYIGRNIVDFHADAEVIADILAKLRAGDRLKDYEARLRCKDGSIRSVVINSSVLFGPQGEFIHTRCFTHDVTERKRLDEAREQFVSILGHDLRNPLSAITVAAQYLLKTGDLPEKHTRAAARIARSADRMSRMIADLLDFARGRMGEGIPIHPSHHDVGPIIRQAIDELQLSNSDRTISVHLPEDTTCHCDPDRFAQVVSNLVGNAIEHGRDPIDVRVVNEPEMIVLEVSNGGLPIPPELLPTVFQPFSRRQPGLPTRTGLGLGLFITSEIVRAHGGSICVKSTNEDGTTFLVRWPRM